MSEQEDDRDETGGGSQEDSGNMTGSDAEGAEEFLRTWSQATAEDLTQERVLRYEWLQSVHLKECSKCV